MKKRTKIIGGIGAGITILLLLKLFSKFSKDKPKIQTEKTLEKTLEKLPEKTHVSNKNISELEEYTKNFKIKNKTKSEYENMIASKEKLGNQGMIGTVYKAKYNGKDIIIKEIIVDSVRKSHIDIAYSKYMSDKEIGPEIYDYFRVDNKYVIFMKKFDMGVDKWLTENYIHTDKCIEVIEKMIKLMRKQYTEANLYCYDIKSQNFVINENDLKVKMIDYDYNHCVPTMEVMPVDEFHIFMLIQLFVTVYTKFLKMEKIKDKNYNVFTHKKIPLSEDNYEKFTDNYEKVIPDDNIIKILKPFYDEFNTLGGLDKILEIAKNSKNIEKLERQQLYNYAKELLPSPNDVSWKTYKGVSLLPHIIKKYKSFGKKRRSIRKSKPRKPRKNVRRSNKKY